MTTHVDTRPAYARWRRGAEGEASRTERLTVLREMRARNEAARASRLVWSAWLAAGALVMSGLKVLAVVSGVGGA